MKNTSDYIDNAKVRNELYSFNQAVKQVFTFYRCTKDGIVVPVDDSCIKNRPLMDRAFFIRNGPIFNFMEDAVVSAENLNAALKGKYSEYKLEDGGKNILIKDKERIQVSTKMDQAMIDDIRWHKGLFYYRSLPDVISSYTLTEEDISALENREIVTRVLGHHNGNELYLIMTRDLIPMAKKADDVVIRVYQDPLIPDEHIYPILVVTVTSTWTFYVIQHILI